MYAYLALMGLTASLMFSGEGAGESQMGEIKEILEILAADSTKDSVARE